MQPLPLNTSDFIHTVYTAGFCSPCCDDGDDAAAAAASGKGLTLAIGGAGELTARPATSVLLAASLNRNYRMGVASCLVVFHSIYDLSHFFSHFRFRGT